MKFEHETVDQRREQIVEMLRSRICNVTFTKVNGETRCMPCTLHADIVPAVSVQELKEQRKKKSNPENLSVWCTDKSQWRSFKLANVTEVLPAEVLPADGRSWTVTLEEDSSTGELILPFTDEMLEGFGWQEGDVLEWVDRKDGSWNLVKKEEKTTK